MGDGIHFYDFRNGLADSMIRCATSLPVQGEDAERRDEQRRCLGWGIGGLLTLAIPAIMGCAAPADKPDFLIERALAGQTRIQEQLLVSQKAFTESIAEAVGVARAAHQRVAATEAALGQTTTALKDLKAAVATTQQDVGTVSGLVKALETQARPAAKPETPTDPNLVTLHLRVPPAPLLKGQKGPEVRALHRALHLAGVRVPLSDLYTKETERAVQEFQRAEAIPPSGAYDTATATHLRQALAGAGSEVAAAAPPLTRPAAPTPLAPAAPAPTAPVPAPRETPASRPVGAGAPSLAKPVGLQATP